MVDQVLDKRFLRSVLGGLDGVAASPDDDEDERRSSLARPEAMHPADRAQLQADLAKAAASLASPAGSTAERRGDDDPASDDTETSAVDGTAFLSSSTEAANLQSAIEQFLASRRPELLQEDEALIADEDDRRGSRSLGGARLRSWDAANAVGYRLFGPFEQTDLRWINSLFAEGLRKFRGKHPFIPRPARTEAVALAEDNLRLIVFGDWGSGIPRAQKMARVLRRELDEGKARGLQQHVIHLGDVYYSGWEQEYRERLLRDWPVRPAEKDSIGSFNLNGNHDMFSGGHALYEVALADERFAAWQGKSTLFHLANSRWQIFGLDTAWEDAALAGDQAAWVLGAAVPGKKTILLSHHQFCSSYETVSPGVTERIAPVLQSLDVAAWLWGHEHRCESYREVAGIRAPRCLGHAGVPVYQTHGTGDPLPPPGEWEYRDYVDGGVELWAKFGGVTMDFHSDSIVMRYLDEDGEVVRTETIR